MVNLLLNVLSILACIFIYYIFLLQSKFERKYRSILIFSVSMVAIILCILYPYEGIDGEVYDLRIVPFLLGAIYGGRKVGFALIVGLIIMNTQLWNYFGFVFSVIFSVVTILYIYHAFPNFLKQNFSQKILIVSIYLFILMGINLIFHFLFDPNIVSFSKLSILIYQYVLSIATIVYSIYIIEYIIKNIRNKEHVLQTEKARVVSGLAASVSHEIRNPLTVTKGFLQLLKCDQISYTKRIEYLDLSLNELDRAQSIISDYLTFAKPFENREVELMRVRKELAYAVQVISPYALMLGVEIVYGNGRDYYIKGNQLKFRQALINIMKNGIEAMPSGGQLIISVLKFQEDVIISIQDTGFGMSSDEISKLGTPFHSTKQKGTGLGTMVAYSIIKAMNGKVSVKSFRGDGTTFWINLPAIKTNQG